MQAGGVASTFLLLMALIAAGQGLRPLRLGRLWRMADRLNYYLLLPALLFTAASERPLTIETLMSVGLAALGIVTVGAVLSLIIRRLSAAHDIDVAGMGQMAYRFNSALGLAVAAAVGDEAVQAMAVAIGITVPFVNAFAVMRLSRGGDGRWTQVPAAILSNPFLLASAGGVALALSGRSLLPVLNASLAPLGAAAVPLALISLGAALNLSHIGAFDRFSIALHSIKLVILPLIALIVSFVPYADDAERGAMILFAALPGSSAAHVLGGHFGASRELVAARITQSTVLSMMTIPLWLAVVVAL